MTKIRKWIRREMDVELFACVHGASMTWVYAFFLWLGGTDKVRFSVIMEMMLLAYLMSWFQKLLFLREKKYGKWEYRIRCLLWYLVPFFLLLAAQLLLGWFSKAQAGLAAGYDVIMICYFIMLWFFLQKFYQDDTGELNQMLRIWKNESDTGEQNEPGENQAEE